MFHWVFGWLYFTEICVSLSGLAGPFLAIPFGLLLPSEKKLLVHYQNHYWQKLRLAYEQMFWLCEQCLGHRVSDFPVTPSETTAKVSAFDFVDLLNTTASKLSAITLLLIRTDYVRSGCYR